MFLRTGLIVFSVDIVVAVEPKTALRDLDDGYSSMSSHIIDDDDDFCPSSQAIPPGKTWTIA